MNVIDQFFWRETRRCNCCQSSLKPELTADHGGVLYIPVGTANASPGSFEEHFNSALRCNITPTNQSNCIKKIKKDDTAFTVLNILGGKFLQELSKIIQVVIYIGTNRFWLVG